MKFNFKLPEKAAPPEGEPKKEEMPPTENDGDESGEYSKADLGKMFASAMKSGDGEAIYEALRKCMDATPSDQ